MQQDIWIVRDGENYRLMYGHLRLANEINNANFVLVNVKGEGKVKIVKNQGRFAVQTRNRRLPLYVG